MTFHRFRMVLCYTVTLLLAADGDTHGSISATSGLETFDGTVIDESTYRIVNRWINPANLTQNDALIFSTIAEPSGVTGIVTRFPAVGVGGAAQVEITPTTWPPAPYTSFAALSLTTDTGGSWYKLDSYALTCELHFSANSFLNTYNTYPGGAGSGRGHLIHRWADLHDEDRTAF